MQELTNFQKEFQKTFQNYWHQKQQQIKDLDPNGKLFYEALANYSLQGGKRTRPALFYYTYQCFSSDRLDQVLQLSLALELMQTNLLIHDDIMDEAQLRRGHTTLHRHFQMSQSYFTPRYGESIATLAGSAAGYLGAQVIIDSPFNPAIRNQALGLYSQVMLDECYGQMLDITFSFQKTISPEQVYEVHRNKTSRYTTELPMGLGAIIAGQDSQDVQDIIELAKKIGIAFQLYDDILGVFGQEEAMGKSATADISEGKKTLLLTWAYKQADPAQKTTLDQIVGQKNISKEQLQQVQHIFRETGSLQESQRQIRQLTDEVLETINNKNWRSPGKRFIIDLIEYFIDREV